MNNVLKIKDLSFSYAEDTPVLNHVSLQLQRGEIMMLMGPNGCGKTTLLKLILRLLPTGSKQIIICDRPQETYSVAELARKIAYVPQSESGANCDYSVREFLLMGRTPHISLFAVPSDEDYRLVEEYAAECGITAILNTPVRCLSGGQYQLATIARTLVQGSELIVMDEPLSALDLQNQAKILKMLLRLKKDGKTLLLSTHDPNHALAINCKVCGFLDGTIAFCGQADRALTENCISAMYGKDIAIWQSREEKHISFCRSLFQN